MGVRGCVRDAGVCLCVQARERVCACVQGRRACVLVCARVCVLACVSCTRILLSMRACGFVYPICLMIHFCLKLKIINSFKHLERSNSQAPPWLGI